MYQGSGKTREPGSAVRAHFEFAVRVGGSTASVSDWVQRFRLQYGLQFEKIGGRAVELSTGRCLETSLGFMKPYVNDCGDAR